ncbi:hypothetical protein BV25DRAFT_1920316 [Artomyces pyxidatus]|uniref:Uncharacterized protein n=1 Tax=Artomyces pyxidatus TaxID=48021 RepID=A0ACB8SL18_9AGAM|nr:hypothetical protein BV25DRAFT_1920316 [Artomyces pyxidatus]
MSGGDAAESFRAGAAQFNRGARVPLNDARGEQYQHQQPGQGYNPSYQQDNGALHPPSAHYAPKYPPGSPHVHWPGPGNTHNYQFQYTDPYRQQSVYHPPPAAVPNVYSPAAPPYPPPAPRASVDTSYPVCFEASWANASVGGSHEHAAALEAKDSEIARLIKERDACQKERDTLQKLISDLAAAFTAILPFLNGGA